MATMWTAEVPELLLDNVNNVKYIVGNACFRPQWIENVICTAKIRVKHLAADRPNARRKLRG